ncbi:MAG TPA: PIN domain-containing protein [Bacilli bacterium]|nr:PIN domain-containing protein [Bacilli bacterium]
MKRILLDTYNYCAAILQPYGGCHRLIELGRRNVFEPVTTDVIMAEFVAKCRQGMTKKNITFSEEQIQRFVDALRPMLTIKNMKKVSIGRDYIPTPEGYKLPLNELLFQITGRSREDLLEVVWAHGKIMPSKADLRDLHVIVAAIEQDCDYIVTNNTKDFPKQIGKIRVITVHEALAMLTE